MWMKSWNGNYINKKDENRQIDNQYEIATKHADVIFTLNDGKYILGNRGILSLKSDYLDRLFTYNNEYDDQHRLVIKMDYSEVSLNHVITTIYGNTFGNLHLMPTFKNYEIDTIFEILSICDLFMFFEITTPMIEYIISNSFDIVTLIGIDIYIRNNDIRKKLITKIESLLAIEESNILELSVEDIKFLLKHININNLLSNYMESIYKIYPEFVECLTWKISITFWSSLLKYYDYSDLFKYMLSKVQGRLILNNNIYIYVVRVFALNCTTTNSHTVEYYMDNIPYDTSIKIYSIKDSIIEEVKVNSSYIDEAKNQTILNIDQNVDIKSLYYIPKISINKGNIPAI